MEVHPMTLLIAALYAFKTKYPDLTDVEGILDNTVDVPLQLYESFITDHPELEGRPLYCIGHREPLKNKHPWFIDYDVEDQSFTHTVCLIKAGWVIDLVHQQIDTTAEPFAVSCIEFMKTEWLVLAIGREAYEYFDQLNAYVQQGTREWQQKGNPLISEEGIDRGIAENITGAKECYAQVLKDIEAGLLFLNGTEEDNVYLRLLNGEYKQRFAV